MSSEWKNKPTECTDIDPREISYIMTIDENGTSSNFNSVFKKVQAGETLNSDDRYFTMTGVIIQTNSLNNFYHEINSIKDRYWQNGCWYNKKKGRLEKVHFHTNEFRTFQNRKKAFKQLNKESYDNFIRDISLLILNTNFEVISINFCLQTMARKYVKKVYNPYTYGMQLIIERFAMFLNNKRKKGIIILESRRNNKNSKPDNFVLHKAVEFISTGKTTLPKPHDISLFRNIKGVFFNPKLSAKDNYLKSYPTIELADLASYPIYKKFKDKSYNGRDWQIIERKLYKYPNYIGKGLKIFPDKDIIEFYEKRD